MIMLGTNKDELHMSKTENDDIYKREYNAGKTGDIFDDFARGAFRSAATEKDRIANVAYRDGHSHRYDLKSSSNEMPSLSNILSILIGGDDSGANKANGNNKTSQAASNTIPSNSMNSDCNASETGSSESEQSRADSGASLVVAVFYIALLVGFYHLIRSILKSTTFWICVIASILIFITLSIFSARSTPQGPSGHFAAPDSAKMRTLI